MYPRVIVCLDGCSSSMPLFFLEPQRFFGGPCLHSRIQRSSDATQGSRQAMGQPSSQSLACATAAQKLFSRSSKSLSGSSSSRPLYAWSNFRFLDKPRTAQCFSKLSFLLTLKHLLEAQKTAEQQPSCCLSARRQASMRIPSTPSMLCFSTFEAPGSLGSDTSMSFLISERHQMSFSSISFFERKANRPEIILHLEDLLADLDDKDIALPKKGKFSLGLRDGLLDLLEEGHCARMVEPLPGLELEGLAHPRTCGCLQVQKE